MTFSYYRFVSSTLLLASLFSTLAVAQTPTLDSEQQAFLTLINNYRSQNGLGPLKVSIALQNSSQWMSNDMSSKNYFSHTDSSGRNPFQRMASYGYSYSPEGENIAAGNSSAQNTFTQWQTACDPDSSGNCTYAHRTNMLNPSYVVMGIGRAYNASSTYRWYWTTDFGGYLDQTLNPGTTTPSAVPPTADSVSPNAGSGTSQVFTFQFSSANGYNYLSGVYGLINSSVSGSSACIVYYAVASRTLYLYNDGDTGVVGALTPGASSTIGNSQCTINGSGFTANGSGNQLTLTVPIAFSPAFTGLKNVYGYAQDQANLNTGWKTLGTWTTGTVKSAAPTVDSVAPNTGSGSSQTFSFKYSSSNGYSYLTGVYGVINNALSGVSGCVFYYYVPSRTLYLFNDTNTAVAGTLTPGAGTSVSNSQCTISGANFTSTGSGNQLTLGLPVTFKPAFNGTKIVDGYAFDQANQNSSWKQVGTWTVQ